MSALPYPDQTEYIAWRDPWHFTRQYSMDDHHIALFYELYSLAFEPLKKLSAARQVLTRAEFVEQMRNDRVAKLVAWGDDGKPLGLTTLSNDLTTVPWISPEYFQDHYPEHWARGAVYYLGFTLAHPSQRHRRFVETLIKVGMQEAVTKNAVIAYDVCAHNEKLLRFSARVTGLLATIPNTKFEHIDTQLYACVTFR